MRNLSKTSKQFSPRYNKGPIIAIDGPAASGKSTAAYLVAKNLGYLYLDTGAMYRALTWKALRDKVDMGDEKALSQLAKESKISFTHYPEGGVKIYLDGEEVTFLIRSPEVDKYVSIVSKIKEVRKSLVAQQRQMGRNGGIVAEGRDIGTVVFPGAEVKIYLTASFEERVRRRWEERKQKGLSLEKEKVKNELITRDRIDTHRQMSPLRKAKGAVVIDNTYLSIDETVRKILEVVKEKLVV
ncbi:MAG: (d)CMP kinase [Candidatus Aerophobetes bacterium]|nr:(d)CMP kinase [Candidatus Aerophobetes bacterium]